MEGPFKIIAGNSHPQLAEDIARYLGDTVTDCTVTYFANGECRTKFNESIRGFNIFIVQTGVSDEEHSINDYIVETLLMLESCKRSDARSITLVMPHFPYARQDKKDHNRAGISASLMTQLYIEAGADRIVSMDLHNGCIQGFTSKAFHNLYGSIILKKYLFDILFFGDEDYQHKFVAISPDEGGFKRANKYAAMFKLPILTVSKQRDYSRENCVSKSTIFGKVDKYLKGRTALIFDDMLCTGGTIIQTANILMENGADNVVVIVTHGLFSGPAIERMNDCESIKKIYVTDTVPQDEHMHRCKKIEVITCSQLFATVIKRLMSGESISELFNV